MKRIIVVFCCVVLLTLGFYQTHTFVFAEQTGSSPESGVTSRIKEAYDFLVGKGTNYGQTDAADWNNDWGVMWNRVMESASWEPDGTATAGDVAIGETFYAGDGDRTIKTGTLNTDSLIDFSTFDLQRYDDLNCSNNNGENDSACAAGDSEYTGEEGDWTLTASGGTDASVTDNAVTETLLSNKVYRDQRTGLYWTDRSSGTMDNEFAYVDGDDSANPSGNSCNFTSTGTANAYCDNQDPLNGYTEDDDVSANDFCLNLELDGDNADGDGDGLTGVETDWRLPTQKELLMAYINGAENNLPNAANYFWSSSENYNNQSNAWRVYLGNGTTNDSTKSTNFYAACVRRG